jgi:hypothetical protein
VVPRRASIFSEALDHAEFARLHHEEAGNAPQENGNHERNENA